MLVSICSKSAASLSAPAATPEPDASADRLYEGVDWENRSNRRARLLGGRGGSVDAIAYALNDVSAEVRLESVQAVTHLDLAELLPELRLLHRRESVTEVREALEDAFRRIDDEEFGR